jgi:hypothetical protein
MSSVNQTTSYDSLTQANTIHIITSPTSIISSLSYKRDTPSTDGVGVPNMANLSQVGSVIRINCASTLEPKKQLSLPYGDALQLTMQLYRSDDL